MISSFSSIVNFMTSKIRPVSPVVVLAPGGASAGLHEIADNLILMSPEGVSLPQKATFNPTPTSTSSQRLICVKYGNLCSATGVAAVFDCRQVGEGFHVSRTNAVYIFKLRPHHRPRHFAYGLRELESSSLGLKHMSCSFVLQIVFMVADSRNILFQSAARLYETPTGVKPFIASIIDASSFAYFACKCESAFTLVYQQSV